MKFNDNYDGAGYQQSQPVEYGTVASFDDGMVVSKPWPDLIAAISSHWFNDQHSSAYTRRPLLCEDQLSRIVTSPEDNRLLHWQAQDDLCLPQHLVEGTASRTKDIPNTQNSGLSCRTADVVESGLPCFFENRAQCCTFRLYFCPSRRKRLPSYLPFQSIIACHHHSNDSGNAGYG